MHEAELQTRGKQGTEQAGRGTDRKLGSRAPAKSLPGADFGDEADEADEADS